MGRFINADAFTSTGQGVLGNNMFAYCVDNPVILADSSRCAAKVCIDDEVNMLDVPWKSAGGGGGFRVLDIEDEPVEQPKNIMEEWAEKGVIYVSADGDHTGGRIENSYLITDPQEMRKYATYLLNESEYKDDFVGSVEGVLFEWDVHNMIYYGDPFFSFFGFDWKENARSVDLGGTIYSDPHPWLNVVMWRLYENAFPLQAAEDRKAHFGLT